LYENYTEPYNIEFNYLYNDKLSDQAYNVVPADFDKSVAMAKLIQEVWMKPYIEIGGDNFLKEHCFRQVILFGSWKYTSQHERVLGTAEGGLAINLFGINHIDFNNLFLNFDEPYKYKDDNPMDLNYNYFHTMHHEFCHILTQLKNYTTDYRTLSAGKFHSTDWINVSDIQAAKEGFVSGYASSEYNEDFAETYSTYLTLSEEGWNKILQQACDTLTDENGEIVYKKDAKGNYVYVKDANGNYIYQTNSNGSLVPSKDANGNVVYALDKEGNYIYLLDADGNKVPKYAGQSKTLLYLESETGIDIYYPNMTAMKYLNVLSGHEDGDSIVYQTTTEGDYVYDAEGNMVPEYYRIPVFEYIKEPMLDTTSRDLILNKLDIIRKYLKDSWSIDMDALRDSVHSHSIKALSIDLKSLK
jgi:substrate import-associated zinc metallohydrolase lipoprotein